MVAFLWFVSVGSVVAINNCGSRVLKHRFPMRNNIFYSDVQQIYPRKGSKNYQVWFAIFLCTDYSPRPSDSVGHWYMVAFLWFVSVGSVVVVYTLAVTCFKHTFPMRNNTILLPMSNKYIYAKVPKMLRFDSPHFSAQMSLSDHQIFVWDWKMIAFLWFVSIGFVVAINNLALAC